MNQRDLRIREILLQILDAEQRLAGLRLELRRLVAGEVGKQESNQSKPYFHRTNLYPDVGQYRIVILR